MKTILATSLLILGLQVADAALPLRPLWKTRQHNADHVTALDHKGNTFLVSESMLMKRDSWGRREWSVPLPESMFVISMTPDPEGNLYVTGGRYRDGSQEIVTARYGPKGRQHWSTTYSGATHMSEIGANIGLDELGNIYVVGRAYVNTNTFAENYHLILSYTRGGVLRWERLESVPTSSALNMVSMAINPNGGVAAVTRDSIVACSDGGALLWTWQAERDSLLPLPDKFLTAFDSSAFKVAGYDRSNQLYVIGTSIQDGQHHPAFQVHAGDGFILREEIIYRAGYLRDVRVSRDGALHIAMDAIIECHYVHDGEDVYQECTTRPAVVRFSQTDSQDSFFSSPALPTGVFSSVAGIDVDDEGRCLLAVQTDADDLFSPEMPQDTVLALYDPRGNQVWGGTYSLTVPEDRIWTLPPSLDSRGGVRAPVFLISRTGLPGTNPGTDLLLSRFRPVVLRGAPKIVEQPAGTGASAGETMNLSVTATGKGRLRYQWRFNGTNIPGATASTLQLQNFSATQAGGYSVEVRNLLGTIITPEALLELIP